MCVCARMQWSHVLTLPSTRTIVVVLALVPIRTLILRAASLRFCSLVDWAMVSSGLRSHSSRLESAETTASIIAASFAWSELTACKRLCMPSASETPGETAPKLQATEKASAKMSRGDASLSTPIPKRTLMPLSITPCLNDFVVFDVLGVDNLPTTVVRGWA